MKRMIKFSLTILFMMTIFLVGPKPVRALKIQIAEETVDSDLTIDSIVLKVDEYLKDFPADDLVLKKTALKEYLIKKLEAEGFTSDEIISAFEQMEQERLEEIIYLAKSYLDEEPLLSREALLSMIAGEFYSQVEVELGLEALQVDWTEQAVKASEGYINTAIEIEDEESFLISRKALREFLVEGKEFTLKEANYGLAKADIDWDEQAFKQAQYYLTADAYSKRELMKKLKSDDFNDKEAAYGIAKTKTDWKEQAVKQAESFLAGSLLKSKENLENYLKQAGFLEAEIDYAVNRVFKEEVESELEIEEPSLPIPEVSVPKKPIIIKSLDFITGHAAISAQAATKKQPDIKEPTSSQSSLTTSKKSYSSQEDTTRVTEADEVEDADEIEGTSFFDSPIFVPVILILVAGNLYLFQKS